MMHPSEIPSALAELESQIEVSFRDRGLLCQALVHSSYLNENPDFEVSSNERLELLGDAVLALLMADQLYRSLPNASEGELTRLRATLVSRRTLHRVASRLGLGSHLLLGRGEERSGGRQRPQALGGAYEALVGALWLDQGLEATQAFVLRSMQAELERVLARGASLDPKTHLQELVQATGQPPPTYRVLAATGPDHAREFTVQVAVGGSALGVGVGSSKRRAEQEAARAALRHIEEQGAPTI